MVRSLSDLGILLGLNVEVTVVEHHSDFRKNII